MGCFAYLLVLDNCVARVDAARKDLPPTNLILLSTVLSDSETDCAVFVQRSHLSDLLCDEDTYLIRR